MRTHDQCSYPVRGVTGFDRDAFSISLMIARIEQRETPGNQTSPANCEQYGAMSFRHHPTGYWLASRSIAFSQSCRSCEIITSGLPCVDWNTRIMRWSMAMLLGLIVSSPAVAPSQSRDRPTPDAFNRLQSSTASVMAWPTGTDDFVCGAG